MSERPLMPIATAVWLIDNTSLSFEQIADFCGLHPLQVKGIADGDVGAGVRGIDPIANHQLAREELEAAEKDPGYRMNLARPKVIVGERPRKGPRYTPVSKRQNRPDAIAWMVKNHPEVSDAQIGKLLGTTKSTIQSVRGRSHWNSSNLVPQDPVGLGLCTQLELDAVVRKAAAKKERLQPTLDEGARLEPAAATVAPQPEPAEEPEVRRREEKVDAEKVFASLGGSKRSKRDDDEDDRF
ncbi:MAG: cell cycle transcriptional regulator TrcR [Parvularculaceae bacterium]